MIGGVWVAAWAASAQGPYPAGNAMLQPDQRFSFPTPERGAVDQTFRLMFRPSIWGRSARFRLSNVFGSRAVTFDSCFVGLPLGGAAMVPGSSRPVGFAGAGRVTIGPGESRWSDPVELGFVDFAALPDLMGRKLALSFAVVGESGPMTWHAKALTTSYVSAPGAGLCGDAECGAMFPFSVASWFFLDAVEMVMPPDSFAIVALGDSITEGTGSTFNGDDRWPDVLSHRLFHACGNRIAVINAGIGGNQVVGPARYDLRTPFRGGPSAVARLTRDVLDLAGVRAVIWSEGINDFSRNGNAGFEAVRDGMIAGVARMRANRTDMLVVGGTLTSSLGSSHEAHGFAEEDAGRQALNAFIRQSGLFDHVIDFDILTTDPQTGCLRQEFVPNSTLGGPGDGLHPNRAGYLAMGSAIDLGIFDLS